MDKRYIGLNIKAYAKVNLFLNVSRKDKNNYHNLESLVCFIDLYDEIKIKKDKKFSIKIKGPFKKFLKNKDNIIKKTVYKFSNLIGVKPNFNVVLNKKIPVSAGLGGGSADAAAIIKGISELTKLNLKKKELYKFAQTIGSDVPVCLYNKNVFFSGYGEIFSSAPKLPNFSLILVNPMKELSTKKVFEKYDKHYIKKEKNVSFLNNKNFFSWILNKHNDLTFSSNKIIPEIKKILDILNNYDNCLLSRMSGSGPTVFGLFKNSLEAQNINKIIRKEYPEWWSAVVNIKT